MGDLGRIILGALILICMGVPAQADLIARFYEGAPKDRFEFTNTGDCLITDAIITLDLSASEAGLIFDTTATGAGVQVYQPFKIILGAGFISSFSTVDDGDTVLEIKVAELGPQESIAFTIDVDDTLSSRETIVADSEISGASVQLVFDTETLTTSFGNTPEAIVKLPDC
jgi:hypothetical protein